MFVEWIFHNHELKLEEIAEIQNVCIKSGQSNAIPQLTFEEISVSLKKILQTHANVLNKKNVQIKMKKENEMKEITTI